MQSSTPNNHGRLISKTAFITGSASGIGRETALLFAREGAKVALGDIDIPKVEETASEVKRIGRESIVVALDVTSENEWKSAISQTNDAWGRLDILVNCAGITDDAPIARLSTAQWRRVMTTNPNVA